MLDDLLPNIPRIYTAIAEWLACLIIIAPLEKKKLWLIKFIIGGFGQILFQLIVGTWPLFLWIPGMIINVLWMLFVIFQTSNIPRKSIYYYGGKAFVLAEFNASFSWWMYCILVLEKFGESYIFTFPFMFFMYLCLLVVYYYLDKLLTRNKLAHHITKKDILLVSLTTIIIFTMSNIGFLLSNTSYSLGNTLTIFIFRTLINLCGLCILIIQENQKYESFLKEELSLINNMFQSQYEQYSAYKESSQIIQRQFHDLKHQLTVIRSEKDSIKRDAYMEEMTQAINTYSATISTGNAILDTILTSKNSICIENKIRFTCFVDGKHLANFNIMDICSIFGNALDNAIESTKKIQDTNKRIIELRVEKKAKFLVISLKNTSFSQLEFENGFPITTKRNKEYHGYGLKSIALITEKYQGNMTISNQDNWFSLKIVFPLK